MRVFFAVLLLVFVSACSGGSSGPPAPAPVPPANDTTIGTAPYAIAHPKFNCSAYLGSISQLQTVHVSWLWNTFGNSFGCINQVLTDSRTKSFELFLNNMVCVRNKNCESRELFYGMSIDTLNTRLENADGWLLQMIKDYSQQAANYLYGTLGADLGGKQCYIAPGLESDLSKKASKIWVDTVKSIFPGCKFVWNPNRVVTNDLNGHDFVELHHNFKVPSVPYIASQDGNVTQFSDVSCNYPRQWTKQQTEQWINTHQGKAEKIYLWHKQLNCIKDRWINPTKRPCDQISAFNCVSQFIKNKE